MWIAALIVANKELVWLFIVFLSALLPAGTDVESVISVKSKDIKPSSLWCSNDPAVWSNDNSYYRQISAVNSFTFSSSL